jgi:hypothetical protein
MVITRSYHHHIFQQEAQRLSDIEIEPPTCSEFSVNHIVYRPLFSSIMEEQILHTLAKEQIKRLAKFGGAHHEDVVKWLSDVEEVFNRAQLQPSNKYLAVQAYLIDSAEKWFRYNKSTITDWSTFKIELIKAYQPSLHQTLLKMEQRLQLPGESIMDYYHDKMRLCLQADSNMSSPMIIHHLTKGLKQSLIAHVIRRHPGTPADFLTVAQDEEKTQITLDGLSRASTTPAANYPNLDDSIDEMVTLVKRPTNLTPRSSNQQQHPSTPPPLMHSTSGPQYTSSSNRRPYRQHPSSSFASRQCYECFQFGHIARYCPNRKNI